MKQQTNDAITGCVVMVCVAVFLTLAPVAIVAILILNYLRNQ